MKRESIELEKFMDREKRRRRKKEKDNNFGGFFLFIYNFRFEFFFISFGLYINKSERRYETTRRRNLY